MEYLSKDADISPCGVFRYTLTRVMNDTSDGLCLVGLNPSVADADRDDRTMRRGVGFALSLGCGWLDMMNAYAFRAQDPNDLVRAVRYAGVEYAIGGDENRKALRVSMKRAKYVVVAYGNHPLARTADYWVRQLAASVDVTLYHLGDLTKDGFPRHPLYLSADADLRPY
jgi:hypothetical protein